MPCRFAPRNDEGFIMEIFSQFGVKPILLAAQVVNFFILLFILKKFLYKPILKVLEERKKRIEDSLKNAEEIEKRLAQTQQESEKIIAQTLKEAQKILDQTNIEAAEILKKANQETDKILLKASNDAKKIVEFEREVLIRQVRTNVGSLITLAFEKIAGKKFTKKDQIEIIEKEVRNLS